MNVPFRDIDILKTRDTWKRSYEEREMDIWELGSLDDNDHSVDLDDAYNQPNMEQREWMNLCGAHPHQVPVDVDLGYRDLDRDHNWFAAYHKYPNIEDNLKFIATSKSTYTSDDLDITNTDTITLNSEQQPILDHLKRQLAGEDVSKLSIVTGPAGTGKSYVIRAITQEVERSYGVGSVKLMAPTCVAANNINGKTIHSGLRFTNVNAGDLVGESERDFQNEMSRVKVIIIDEFSMVGQKLLGKIDQRLRQANPDIQDQVMGNYIVYLFGDFNQLQPVGDQLLYSIPHSELAAAGKLAYLQFQKVFVLNTVMRQLGADQLRFKELLQRVSSGAITTDDYNFLKIRFANNNVHLSHGFTIPYDSFQKMTESVNIITNSFVVWVNQLPL